MLHKYTVHTLIIFDSMLLGISIAVVFVDSSHLEDVISLQMSCHSATPRQSLMAQRGIFHECLCLFAGLKAYVFCILELKLFVRPFWESVKKCKVMQINGHIWKSQHIYRMLGVPAEFYGIRFLAVAETP